MSTTSAVRSSATDLLLAVGARMLLSLRLFEQAEQGRFLLFLPVFLGAGVLIYFALPQEPTPLVTGGAVSLALLLFAVCIRDPEARLAAGLVLALALGFGRAAWRAETLPPLMAVPHHAVIITGRVTAVQRLPNGRRILVRAPSLDGGAVQPRAVRVKLRRGDGTEVAHGDSVRLRALLYGAERAAYPGGWNIGRGEYFAGLGAVGFAISPVSVTRRAKAGPFAALQSLREAIAARVLAVLPLETGSIAATLLTGFEHSIPPAERQDFVTAGLAHLLAVAGLHIGIVMASLYGLARFLVGFWERLLLRVPAKFVASGVAFTGGAFYAALTGFHVPIVRSLAMAALVLMGILLGRRAISLRGLALAALVIIVLEPEEVVGPSFQMSFSAVLALIAGYEAAGRRLFRPGGPWLGRLGRYLTALAFTSLLAGGASMPFAAYHFQQIQPYWILANLIAVPLTAVFILPLGMVALLLMPLHLAPLALVPMGRAIAVVLWVARQVGRLPHAMVMVPPISGRALVLVAVGLALLGLFRSRLRLLGLAPLGAGLIAACLTTPPDVLVSPTANFVAVHAAGTVRIVRARRRDRFLLKQWRPLWPRRTVEIGRARDVCADGRCRFDHGRVLYLANAAAARAGCGDARVVVSPEPLHGACRAPGRVVIDRFTVWRDGAIALRFRGDRILWRSDRMVEGARPWVPPWPKRWHRDHHGGWRRAG